MEMDTQGILKRPFRNSIRFYEFTSSINKQYAILVQQKQVSKEL